MTTDEWKALFNALGKQKTDLYRMIGQIESMQMKLINEVKDVAQKE